MPPRVRLIVAALLLGGLQTGCKLSGLDRPPYPADPLLLSKKPDPDGKTSLARATQVAAIEPATPAFPTSAFASRRHPELSDPPTIRSVPAQPTALPGGKVTLIPALRSSPVEDYGHGPDRSWLQGTLERHYDGYFHLRYGEPTAADPWGGKVRLEDDARLDHFRDGDAVRVEGVIVPGTADAPANFDRCPRYRIRSIQLLRFRN